MAEERVAAKGNSRAAAPPPGAFGPDGFHVVTWRIYYEDTDAAGVVYYANYLRFAERARTEMMRLGAPDAYAAMGREGLLLVVRRVEADYLRPARLDDAIAVTSRILRVGAASLDLSQSVRRGGEVLVDMVVRLACIDGAGRVRRLPTQLRGILRRLI